MVLRIRDDMLRRFQQEMLDDPGFIPVVLLRIPAPINGDFNWKDAFIRLHEQFNETLIARKVLQAPVIELDGEVVSNAGKLVREALRRSIRNCIQHRGTKLLIIDEASHLLIARTRNFYYQQFEMLKSLSQDFGIPLLLSGAYDLLDIREFNGQLIRRTKIVHLQRYSLAEVLDHGSELGQSFVNALYTLLEKIPLPKEDGLINEVQFFYLHSLGCIGILKSWLQTAFEAAWDRGANCLTREILAETARPRSELLTIEKEIRAGESRLRDIPMEDLARSLGMATVPNLFGPPKPMRVNPPGAKPAAPKKAGGKGKPGIRRPGRDQVGGL